MDVIPEITIDNITNLVNNNERVDGRLKVQLYASLERPRLL